MDNIYNENFYKNRHTDTLYSAKKILGIVKSIIPQQQISSVLDFGCGIGTWLSILKNKNCKITGIDGPWVPKQYLENVRHTSCYTSFLQRIQAKAR